MTEEQVFQQARQIADQSAREAFLLEACEGNERLLRRVRKLLAVERDQPSFLETPVLSFAETLAVPPASLDRHLIENYELQELLGEGGFGLVYRAQQLRPVQRTVAVKLIKPGMDSQQVVARFSLEQQALARMTHPQIAAIFDCGQLQNGRLWFAMEYVPGRSITEFADHFQLNLTQRIRLLIDVCNAVEHAHQRGIIHRDLKPSNLMVAGDRDHWQLKVIDFGIARAIDQAKGDHENGDRNRLTRGPQLMGTPLYMSPEQASSESADIDIRADVYSLGSVLYEMLVGATPFERLSQEPSAWERVLFAIREVDPVRPSAVLQASSDKQAVIARSRQTSIYKLIHECQRDLDWIVMKCLEKKRESRYQTVSELRDDLLRYVDGDVVLAGPPTWISKLRKYARKHRVALLVSATIMGSLALGLIVSLWQANRAYRAEAQAKIDRDLERAARLEADEQTQVSRAVTDFLTNLLQQADIANQDDPAGRDPNLTVRTVLLRAAEQIAAPFSDSPQVEVVVRTTLANSLRGVGSFQEAVSQARQAVGLAETALANDHPHRLRAEHTLAFLLTETQEIEAAIQLLQRLEKVYDDKGPLESVNHQRITLSLAKALEAAGRFVEAEPLIQQVVQKRAETLGDEHPETRGARYNLALLWSKMGRLAPAEQILRQMAESNAKDLGDTHPMTIRAIHSLATNLYLQGKRSEAEPLFLKAETLAVDKLGGDHPVTLSVWNDLANLYSDSNRDTQALELYQRVLEGRQKTLGDENPATLDAMNNLAVYWAEHEQRDRAISLLESVVTLRRKISGISHEDTLLAINNLAFLHQSSGHDQRAVELYKEAWTAAKDELSSNHPTVVTLAANYAQSLSFVGDWSGAADVLQGNVAATRHQFGDQSIEYAAQASRLATVLCELQRWNDALPLAQAAWAIRREQLPGRLAVGWSQAMLGHIQFEMGQAESGLENLLGGAQLVTEYWEQVTPANQTNAVKTLQWLIAAYEKQEQAADAQRWREKLAELVGEN